MPRAQGAGTDVRVYMEMTGVVETCLSGDVRLVDVETHQKAFQRDALDLFQVRAVWLLQGAAVFCIQPAFRSTTPSGVKPPRWDRCLRDAYEAAAGLLVVELPAQFLF